MKSTILILSRILILLALSFYFSSKSLIAQTETDYGPTEILFIGSSYFGYNNLPGIFEDLALSASKDIYIFNYNPGGLFLADHAEDKFTLTLIKERKWDFIVLQGVGSLMAYPDSITHHPVLPALLTLKQKIMTNCPSTRIIYCLPWAFEDGMTWVGWPDTYKDMQELIYIKTLEYSNNIGFTIAPVGWSWYKVLDEKDYPLHYLHHSDWNHPSLKGSYLMACTIFSAIFIESTEEINFNSDLEAREADYFKTVASNIVLENLDLWKITPYVDTTYSQEIEDSTHTDTTSDNTTTVFYKNETNENKFLLYQNYPNPFSAETYIKYYLTQETKVELSIFDLVGNKKITILNEDQFPGIHQILFDSSGLNKGTYICCVKTNYGMQSKKIQVIK